MKFRLLILSLLVVAASQAAFGQLSGTNPLVRFHTDFGDMDVYLVQNIAPVTVTNFLKYVNRGDYDNSFIHRSPPNFVVQGGAYKLVSGQLVAVRQDAAIQNEFHISNTRGTIAMAKQAGDPNSATNQWFFNESDANAPGPNGLDTQNGGFTVFGRIINKNGLETMDTIAAVPTCNPPFAPPFEWLPLRNYDCNTKPPITDSNVVHVIWIKVVPQIVALTRQNATTIRVQGRGTANTTYKLDMSSSPAGNTFTTSVNVTTGSGGNFTHDDTSSGTKKFYRVSIP